MTDPNRPQPVVDAAKLGGLVSAAFVGVGGAVFFVARGINADNLVSAGTAVGVGVTAVTALGVYLVSLFQGRKAAAKVTPLDAPQDARGVDLVPVDELGEHSVEAIRARLKRESAPPP